MIRAISHHRLAEAVLRYNKNGPISNSRLIEPFNAGGAEGGSLRPTIRPVSARVAASGFQSEIGHSRRSTCRLVLSRYRELVGNWSTTGSASSSQRRREICGEFRSLPQGA